MGSGQRKDVLYPLAFDKQLTGRIQGLQVAFHPET